MPTLTIPARFPATSSDIATHVARTFGQHMELGCRLTFDTHLDADVLARAVRLSLDAQPVLGCALRTGAFAAWWERLPDLDRHAAFSLSDSDDPERDAPRFQTMALDAAEPQVGLHLLRADGGDDVVFAMSHDVADGQAVKQYAYLLADLYTRLMADPEYVPAPDLTPRPTAADVWKGLTPDQRRAASRTPKMTMPNWEVPHVGVTGGGRTLRELRIEPERFRAVREYGRARSATVNAMLLTAFFRAIAREFPPPEGQAMSLPFTVDHRRYLQGADDLPISNLAISIWLGVPREADESFDATLDRVQEQLTAWSDALWGVKSLAQATAMTRIGYGPMKAVMGAISAASARAGKTSPVFTNIGVIDDARLRFGDAVPVAARLSGPAAFGPSLVPTISTYRDELTVSMGLCADDIDPRAIEKVLSHLDEELRLA